MGETDCFLDYGLNGKSGDVGIRNRGQAKGVKKGAF